MDKIQSLETATVFHNNIVSELCRVSEAELVTDVTKPIDAIVMAYGKDNEGDTIFGYETREDEFKDMTITVAKYALLYKDIRVPVQVHLYYNPRTLFKQI